MNWQDCGALEIHPLVIVHIMDHFSEHWLAGQLFLASGVISYRVRTTEKQLMVCLGDLFKTTMMLLRSRDDHIKVTNKKKFEAVAIRTIFFHVGMQ